MGKVTPHLLLPALIRALVLDWLSRVRVLVEWSEHSKRHILTQLTSIVSQHLYQFRVFAREISLSGHAVSLHLTVSTSLGDLKSACPDDPCAIALYAI